MCLGMHRWDESDFSGDDYDDCADEDKDPLAPTLRFKARFPDD